MAFWGSKGEMRFLMEPSPEKKQRQRFSQCYFVNGAIYTFTIQCLMERHSRFDDKTIKYLMPQLDSIDLDSEDDWILAEALLAYQVS